MVNGSNMRWRIRVEPSTQGTVTVVLPVTGDCDEAGAVCTSDGRSIANRMEANVAGPLSGIPLTASFEEAPGTHDGSTPFTFELRFSEEVETSHSTLEDEALEVNGGEVTSASRLVNGSNIRWTIRVEPSTQGTVTVVLPVIEDCDEAGAVCTADGRSIASRVAIGVFGPETPNSAPSGLPVISGIAKARETLTADTSGIADADGLDNATFSYQWIASDGNADTDIPDASEAIYQLQSDDAGKTIKVRLSFTDDRGAEETLTSVATAAVAAHPNSPATGAPTISGTAEVGQTLTADTSGIADSDGLDKATFPYQWIAGDGNTDTDIQDATGSTYEVSDGDVGKTIKVRVTFTDDWDAEETLTGAPTGQVEVRPNRPATGAPTIRGTAQEGKRLRVNKAGIADEDGVPSINLFQFQWIVNDGVTDTHIPGAAGRGYRPSCDDVGKTIKVQVRFWDRRGHPETLISAPTETVAALPNKEATGAPTISGTAQAGETLTANTSGIADADGLDDATFAYQWVVNDGTTDANIEDATDSAYEVSDDDVGKTVKVKVSFTDDRGHAESLTSAATAAVAAGPNSPATGAPTISGTAQVDETLTANTSGIADADGLANATFSYQWIAGGTDIDGATGSSRTLTSSEEGQTIQVRVTFTDDDGFSESLTSEATETVRAPWPATLTVEAEDWAVGYSSIVSPVLGALSATSIELAGKTHPEVHRAQERQAPTRPGRVGRRRLRAVGG